MKGAINFQKYHYQYSVFVLNFIRVKCKKVIIKYSDNYKAYVRKKNS